MKINEIDIEKTQKSDMQTKVIKENSYIFSSFLCTSFNSSIKTSKFPSNF